MAYLITNFQDIHCIKQTNKKHKRSFILFFFYHINNNWSEILFLFGLCLIGWIDLIKPKYSDYFKFYSTSILDLLCVIFVLCLCSFSRCSFDLPKTLSIAQIHTRFSYYNVVRLGMKMNICKIWVARETEQLKLERHTDIWKMEW